MLNTFDELIETAKQAKTNRLDEKAYYREMGINREEAMLALYKGTFGIKGLAVKYPITRRVCRLLRPAGRYSQACAYSDALINDFEAYTALYQQSYELLSDTWSRQVFINLTAGEMLTDPRYGNPFGQIKQGVREYYCVDLTSAEKEQEPFIKHAEIFVDCGAYTGDTLQEFIRENKSPAKYFGFEPNYENYIKARRTLKASGIAGTVYNAGVYNTNGEMGFCGKGVAGSISASGKTTVKVLSLDETIKEPVTLIKMDIEGSEEQALEGGASLIRAYKPKLMICIYHKPTDFRTLPLLIKLLNADYSEFYIRYLSPYYSAVQGFGDVVLFVR